MPTDAERLDLCFVHVPKTAGLSWLQLIEASLGERESVEVGVNWEVLRFVAHPRLQLTKIGHETRVPNCATLRDYRRKRCGPSFVVAFVRNPYDRLVSALHFLQRDDLPALDLRDAQRYVRRYEGNFRAFVRDALEAERPAVFDQIHLQPQCSWLTDEHDQLLPDLVGRFEDLAAANAEIARRINVPLHAMPHANVTPHEPSHTYYDEATRRLVARAYRTDLELFGYPVD